MVPKTRNQFNTNFLFSLSNDALRRRGVDQTGTALLTSHAEGKPQTGFCEGEAHNDAGPNVVILPVPKGGRNREHQAGQTSEESSLLDSESLAPGILTDTPDYHTAGTPACQSPARSRALT
jgi:hypothetical protein